MVFINLAVLDKPRKAEEEWNRMKNSLKDRSDANEEHFFNLLVESRPGPLTFQMLSGVDIDTYVTDENFFVRNYADILEFASSRINSKKLLPLLSKIFVLDGDAALLYKSLIVLIDSLKNCRAPSTKVDNICAILTSLFTSDFIPSALARACISAEFNNNCWEDVIRLIVSYPSRLANTLKNNLPQFFSPENYVRVLFVDIIKAVQILTGFSRLEDVQIPIVDPLSLLISKILVNFDCVGEFVRVVGLLEPAAKDDAAYLALVPRILFSLEGSAVNHAAYAVLSGVSSTSVRYFFGDNIIRNSKWKHCLCDALFFRMFYTDDRILKNLVRYLRSFIDVLFEIFVDLLDVWSDKTSLTRTSFEQHLYVSKAIILCSEALSAPDITKPEDLLEKVERKLFLGVPIHLELPDEKMRAVGMIVAECVLGNVRANSQDTIKFDYDDMLPTTKSIIEQLRTIGSATDESPVESKGSNEQIHDYFRSVEPVRLASNEIAGASDEITDTKISEISTKTSVNVANDEDWDSDDELEPYDLSNDVKTSSLQKPLYLRDLIDGLLEKSNADIWIGCVENCEELVRTQLSRNDPCVGVEILSLLLTLERTFYMENFETIRYSAAVSIVNVYPEECAPCLCEEFHQPPGKYTIAHKTLMLDVLAGSARALSLLKTDVSACENKPRRDEVRKKEELEWQRIVRERIEQKTKSKSRPKEVVARVNNFNACVGHFFYPLLRGSCKYVGRTPQNLMVNVVGLDWYALLAHYVDTLAIIMRCAVNCVSTTKMALELIEFTKPLRFHVNSSVRCSVLRCTGSVLISVPRSAFSEPEITNMVVDIREWIEAIAQGGGKLGEQNTECRTLAAQILALVCSA